MIPLTFNFCLTFDFVYLSPVCLPVLVSVIECHPFVLIELVAVTLLLFSFKFIGPFISETNAYTQLDFLNKTKVTIHFIELIRHENDSTRWMKIKVTASNP